MKHWRVCEKVRIKGTIFTGTIEGVAVRVDSPLFDLTSPIYSNDYIVRLDKPFTLAPKETGNDMVQYKAMFQGAPSSYPGGLFIFYLVKSAGELEEM